MNERDIKPDNIISTPTDARIVYGARCTWWESIAAASSKPSGLPCCPHCGSVLFEVESSLVWFTSVDAFAEHSNDADYRAFIEWLCGKCFPSVTHARLEFRLDRLCRKAAEPRRRS